MSGELRALEVCAGIGGLSLGLEMAGFTCAGLVEIDPRCRAHLREKWPHVPVFADMRALTDDDLHAVGPVDLLAGGIPCQPHSVAGKRLGHEDERDLWPDFLALGLRLGAKALLVENVRGLASSPGGLDRIARDLEASGYCWWATSLRAADVGAPHLRDRLFICAVRMGDAEGIGSPAGAGQPRVRHSEDQPQRPELARELADHDHTGSLLEELPGRREQVQTGRELRSDPNGCRDPLHPYCLRGSCCFNPNACDGNDCWLARNPERMPVDPDEDDDEFLADIESARRQGRWRPTAGTQLAAAERGGALGDAEPSGPLGLTIDAGWHHLYGQEAGRPQGADRPALASPWSDARPILCRDGKRRLVPAELAVQRMADRPAEELASRFPVGPAEPGRVARLRALGNAVVPLQAYVPARALLEVMTGIPAGGDAE